MDLNSSVQVGFLAGVGEVKVVLSLSHLLGLALETAIFLSLSLSHSFLFAERLIIVHIMKTFLFLTIFPISIEVKLFNHLKF